MAVMLVYMITSSRHVNLCCELIHWIMNTPPPSQLQPEQQTLPWVRHPDDQTAVPKKVSILVSIQFVI